MKIKFKLSILVISIMMFMISGISVLLLQRASGISINLSKRGLKYLAEQRAEHWKGYTDSYIHVLRTLANEMTTYEHIPPEERRQRYDDMMYGVIEAEKSIINLYTVWKPNALDNMDDQFINRIGSSESGQYALTYTRETGVVLARTTIDIDGSMAYLNGPNSKNDRVEHPFRRTINGNETFLVRLMVPIIDPRTNETIGGVGCLLTIDMMQGTLEQIIHDHDEIIAMVIYAGDGTIMASEQPERIGKLLVDADFEYGDSQRDAYQAVLEHRVFTARQRVPRLGTTLEIVMIPFTIGNSNNGWTIMIASGDTYILADVKKLTAYTIIITIIAIAAAAVIVFIALSYITKPIVNVTNTLKDISEGEGDLTHAIPEHGNDEIADLSRYFNKTLEKIKNLIITIKKQTIDLQDTGNDLAGNMTETAAAINEIASNIQSIRGRVINQSASVTQTNATMEQITGNIEKLNQQVERQSSSVSQSSSAIEEMLANVQSVTQTLVSNGENVNNLSSASESGRTGLQTVASDVLEIARESQGLLEINTVMNNIASQTNLLSMNAAIEAAHAGDAGRGFAVVADEIRKLAESSGEQSKTISAILKKMKSSIDKITESTNNVLARFEAIDTSVRVVSDQEADIRGAMEEQDKGSKQILEAIGELNDITHNVGKGTAEMLEGSKEVIHESKNLERVSEEITGGMNEMATGAEQINAAVTRVNEICVHNKQNIDLLIKEVSRFKVE